MELFTVNIINRISSIMNAVNLAICDMTLQSLPVVLIHWIGNQESLQKHEL
jgi:hypothetical protein